MYDLLCLRWGFGGVKITARRVEIACRLLWTVGQLLPVSSKSDAKNDVTGTAVSVTTGVLNPPSDMWDTKHPRSFMALLPDRWRQGFEDARFERPELFDLDERDLYNTLRKAEQTPNAAVNTIRLKLWMEYERCQAGEGRRIEIFKVLGEVCRTPSFEKTILARPERAAWLLCPPTAYRMKVEEALTFGLDKLRDILEMDCITVEEVSTADGKTKKKATVNVKLGELQAKIVNMLDQRLHGAARVSVEQTNRSYNLNVTASSDNVRSAVVEAVGDDLQSQIMALEARERRALNLPPDVKVEGELVGTAAVVDVDAALVGDPDVDL